MIIRAQNSFNFINFDNIKEMGIESHGEKFRIVARTTSNNEPVGTTLAEYKNVDFAKMELKRFYQAYEAGEKTFLFKSDRMTNFLYNDDDAEIISALMILFRKFVLNPEQLSETVLKLAEKETETEKDGSRKEI